MSYLKNTLTQNEKLLNLSKPHWIIYSKCVMWIVLTLICYFILPKFKVFNFILYKQFSLTELLALVAFVMALFSALGAYLAYETSAYAITTRRVLMKRGLLKRITLEIYIAKIESIRIHQTIIGRLLGYGTINISGVGGSKDPFTLVPNPIVFQKTIQQQLARTHTKAASETSNA